MSDFDSPKENSVGTPTESPLRPDRFSFGSGGMLSYQSVEWNGKALIYSERGSKIPNRTIEPTEQQWREFWVAVEKVELWKWQPCYHNPSIKDGWMWHIEITRGTLRIRSMGANAAPDDADVRKTVTASWPNKPIKDFQSAVEDLIGFRLGVAWGPRFYMSSYNDQAE
jgi:hypothetical protein